MKLMRQMIQIHPKFSKVKPFEQLPKRIPVFSALQLAILVCKKKKTQQVFSKVNDGLAFRSAKSLKRSAQSPSISAFYAVSALYVFDTGIIA